jgi:hypothetical protein
MHPSWIARILAAVAVGLIVIGWVLGRLGACSGESKLRHAVRVVPPSQILEASTGFSKRGGDPRRRSDGSSTNTLDLPHESPKVPWNVGREERLGRERHFRTKM